METKFQTSFIPKKPLTQVGVPTVGFNPSVPHQKHAVSLYFNIAVLFFIVSLGAGAGMYILKNITLNSQENLKQELAQRQKQFNPNLIEDLQRVNTKITTAQQLLANHVAMSNIFDIVGRMTIEKVRFTSLDLSITPGSMSSIKLSLKGYGTSLSAVAFQSDVLGQLDTYNLRKIVKNPILSDPTSDENGVTSFSLTAAIDPSTMLYSSMNTASSTTQ